jgi:hypothetical protein
MNAVVLIRASVVVGWRVVAGPNKWLWVVGFLINFVFSFLAALGINLQKHSLRVHEAELPRPPPIKQKVPWLLSLAHTRALNSNLPSLFTRMRGLDAVLGPGLLHDPPWVHP